KQLVDEPVLRCDEIVNGQAARPAVQARVSAQENLHPPTGFPAGGGFARLPGRRSLRGLRSLLPSAERWEFPSRQVKRCRLPPTAAGPRLRLGRYGRPAPADRQVGYSGPPRLLAACAARSRAAVAPRPALPPPVPRAAARQGAATGGAPRPAALPRRLALRALQSRSAPPRAKSPAALRARTSALRWVQGRAGRAG